LNGVLVFNREAAEWFDNEFLELCLSILLENQWIVYEEQGDNAPIMSMLGCELAGECRNYPVGVI
jgi:hypothetical protein